MYVQQFVSFTGADLGHAPREPAVIANEIYILVRPQAQCLGVGVVLRVYRPIVSAVITSQQDVNMCTLQ